MTVPSPDLDGPAMSLRARLRRDTAEAHAALDAAFAGMEEAADPALYHRFIRMNHACHGALEPWLARSDLGRAVPGWRAPQRLAALEADIARMGLRPLAPPAGWDGAPALPEAMGAAYVLEGSRLGAKLIRRRLAERSIERVWPGVSLLFLDGAAADDRFKVFMAALAAIDFSEPDARLCVAAADAAFGCFREASERAGGASL